MDLSLSRLNRLCYTFCKGPSAKAVSYWTNPE